VLSEQPLPSASTWLLRRRLPAPVAAPPGELAGWLGYAGQRHQAPGALSGGTRQKLTLTLALMHDLDLLLLDEPYQGFDLETYLQFWDLVTGLRARRNTIVTAIPAQRQHDAG
jgi:ABC-2 type transport system ATP-binding protein